MFKHQSIRAGEKWSQLYKQMPLNESDLDQSKLLVRPFTCLLLSGRKEPVGFVSLLRHQCICHALVVSDSRCQMNPLGLASCQRFRISLVHMNVKWLRPNLEVHKWICKRVCCAGFDFRSVSFLAVLKRQIQIVWQYVNHVLNHLVWNSTV